MCVSVLFVYQTLIFAVLWCALVSTVAPIEICDASPQCSFGPKTHFLNGVAQVVVLCVDRG